jgi:hypothetical protein
MSIQRSLQRHNRGVDDFWIRLGSASNPPLDTPNCTKRATRRDLIFAATPASGAALEFSIIGIKYLAMSLAVISLFEDEYRAGESENPHHLPFTIGTVSPALHSPTKL